MPQSLSKVLIHVIFSTKSRKPFLRDRDDRLRVHEFIGGISREQACPPIIVGGTGDHVHLLATLGRSVSQAELVKEVKRASSLWIKKKLGRPYRLFGWQTGYGVFSISQSQIAVTRKYIADQEKHHQKLSFQDEFRRFLKKYDITYDERFVWD